MKSSILDKLQSIADRHEEVGALLSDPDVIGNQNRFRDLSKEYAELEPIVKAYMEYMQVQENISEAKLLLKDADTEIREMAQEELKSGETELSSHEAELLSASDGRWTLSVKTMVTMVAIKKLSARLSEKVCIPN